MSSLTILSNSGRYLAHVADWRNCTKCEIGKRAHSHVFARGTLPCDILFIGEAPGKTENLTGWPFVGKAGKLLDAWVGYAQNQLRPAMLPLLPENEQPPAEVFTYAITNTVLCRPCDGVGMPNREPTGQEKGNCSSRLAAFIAIAKPKALITVGRHAREAIPEWENLPVLAIKHPMAYGYQGRGTLEASKEEAEKIAEFILQEVLI